MSDNYIGLIVTFEKEINEEYLDTVKKMIKSIKGVIDVRAEPSSPEHWYAKKTAQHELLMQILEILK